MKTVIMMSVPKKKLANFVAIREILRSYRRSEWMNQALKAIQYPISTTPGRSHPSQLRITISTTEGNTSLPGPCSGHIG